MAIKFHIYPSIGIARLGNSPDEFYLSPETTGGLPIQCDSNGNAIVDPVTQKEKTVKRFKDEEGRVKRQGARFQLYGETKDGKVQPVKVGDKIDSLTGPGTIVDIKWTVYLANKKAEWYEFQQLEGEHGYAPDHPRRNANITDPNQRERLMIDPGPRTIGCNSDHRRASFARGTNQGGVTATFPPPDLQPFSIDTLGDIMTDDQGRLVVLGGHGHSGMVTGEFGAPFTTSYANNDGWFDDTSDGPVMAIIQYYDEKDKEVRLMEASAPAWVIVGYPRYAPEIPPLITMDDLLYDLNIREFCFRPEIYGPGNFHDPIQVDPKDTAALNLWRAKEKWFNPKYHPDFLTEIFPILTRPFNYQWLTNVLGISNDAHEVNNRGDFDMSKISTPPPNPVDPNAPHDPLAFPSPVTKNDPYKYMRMFIYQSLRQPGEENVFLRTVGVNPETNPIYGKELMPLLSGDNPITNMLPSKFLRLTDTQLFLLKQWAEGNFKNEKPFNACNLQSFPDGQQFVDHESLTRGVLGNMLGGAFCPGAETCWIMRNPSIYSEPFRIKASPAFYPKAGSTRISGNNSFIPPGLSTTDNFEVGLEPGDITKRSGIPWQTDFNECSWQDIDVTYEVWNKLYYPNSTNDPSLKRNKVNLTLWWPSHRPMEVYSSQVAGNPQIEWSAYIPATFQGDMMMVSAWKEFGFVVKNPGGGFPAYWEVERNPEWIPKTDL